MHGLTKNLVRVSAAFVLSFGVFPETGHTQAAAGAVAPASQAAAQAAQQIISSVTTAINSSALQASAAGAAFSKFNQGAALSDLDIALKNHPAFQGTVQRVVQALGKPEQLTATQGKALAGVLELAASLKNSVAFQVTADQAIPYDKSALQQAITLAQATQGVGLNPNEIEIVAASFYSLLAGSELVNLILDNKLQEDHLGFRLLESFNSEGAAGDPAKVISNQYAVLQSLDGTGSAQSVLEMARGLRSCANFQNVGR